MKTSIKNYTPTAAASGCEKQPARGLAGTRQSLKNASIRKAWAEPSTGKQHRFKMEKQPTKMEKQPPQVALATGWRGMQI